MSAERSRPARTPGRCKRCGGWIRRGQPALIAPFRHPGCAAWRPGELDALAARITANTPVPANAATQLPPRPDPAPTAREERPFVVVMDASEINDQIGALASRLLAIDAQHDTYVRFNPGHSSDCPRLCGDRRREVEYEIEYLRGQLALRAIQEETR